MTFFIGRGKIIHGSDAQQFLHLRQGSHQRPPARGHVGRRLGIREDHLTQEKGQGQVS